MLTIFFQPFLQLSSFHAGRGALKVLRSWVTSTLPEAHWQELSVEKPQLGFLWLLHGGDLRISKLEQKVQNFEARSSEVPSSCDRVCYDATTTKAEAMPTRLSRDGGSKLRMIRMILIDWRCLDHIGIFWIPKYSQRVVLPLKLCENLSFPKSQELQHDAEEAALQQQVWSLPCYACHIL